MNWARILYLLSKLPGLIMLLVDVFKILGSVTDEDARIYMREMAALQARLREATSDEERREIAARIHDIAVRLRHS